MAEVLAKALLVVIKISQNLQREGDSELQTNVSNIQLMVHRISG